MTVQNINIKASADDATIDSVAGPTYAALSAGGRSAAITFMRCERVFASPNYNNSVSTMAFDTSGIPDGATITSAKLRLYIGNDEGSPNFADNRDFAGDWMGSYAATNADWVLAINGTAFSTPISSLTANTLTDFPLTSPNANVNKSGTTAIRIGISGGQPTGVNKVMVHTFDHATDPEPVLQVTFDTDAINVGAPITGVAFPPRHTNLGPYKSSGGNYYFFGRDTTNTGQVEPQKCSSGEVRTLQVSASIDDQSVSKTGASYPPSGTLTRDTTNTSTMQVSRNLTTGTYRIQNGLIRFDTSTIGATETVFSARFLPTVSGVTNTDGRNLTGEWYSWDGTSDSDWTSTAASDAFSMAVASLATGGAQTSLPLTNAAANINKSGYTSLRLHVDGGTPTANNIVNIRPVDFATPANRPVLEVTLGVNPITGAFTPQTQKLMSSATTTAIEAMACYQVGDVIHVATQVATGAVYYNSYNMATDTWGLTTSEVAVAAAAFAPVTNTTFVDLVVRSNGEVVVVYNAGQTAMSSTFNMVRLIRRTGTATWVNISGGAGGTNVDNGGSVDWRGGAAALGASDRVHFFVGDSLNSDGYQRTLTAANALQTFPASFDTSAQAFVNMVPKPRSYADAGTTRVRALYGRFDTAARPTLAALDSSDAPTVSTEAITTGGAIRVLTPNFEVFDLAVDGTTLHALYADSSTSALMHDSSVSGGGAWGTDVNELAGTINHIIANVYDRSGTKLAMVLDDGGTLKYAEVGLGAALPAAKSLLWPTENSQTVLMRR